MKEKVVRQDAYVILKEILVDVTRGGEEARIETGKVQYYERKPERTHRCEER